MTVHCLYAGTGARGIINKNIAPLLKTPGNVKGTVKNTM
jgi:hypothetical protein